MLQGTPTPDHLARVYYALGRIGVRTVGRKAPWPYTPETPEALIGLAAEMSRWDPRLFEALVEYVGRTWRDIRPVRWRAVMRRMQTPQVIGVIGGFVEALAHDPEADGLFSALMKGWTPVSTQLFFHHLYSPGSARATGAAATSVAEFSRWGFLSDLRPVIAQAGKQTVGTYDAAARRAILQRLLVERSTVTIAQYLAALHRSISRQQAYLDLRQFPKLMYVGRGRAARWRMKNVS